MRSVVTAVLGLAMVTAVVSAQTKKSEEDFTFSSDVHIGKQVLKAGDYHFVCDAKGVTISRVTVRSGGDGDSYRTKIAEIPAQTKALPEKSAHSEMVMPKASDGLPQVQAIFIQGSNVEYVIQQ